MLASLLRPAAVRAAAVRPALPALAVRSLRVSAPAQQSSVPSVTGNTVVNSSGATVPVDKFFDDESLVEHQARVRHADPANRTFNYTMVGTYSHPSLRYPSPRSQGKAQHHRPSSFPGPPTFPLPGARARPSPKADPPSSRPPLHLPLTLTRRASFSARSCVCLQAARASSAHRLRGCSW
jgi:hypothetical protein